MIASYAGIEDVILLELRELTFYSKFLTASIWIGIKHHTPQCLPSKMPPEKTASDHKDLYIA